MLQGKATRWEMFKWGAKGIVRRVRRMFPHLVWYGQDVEVLVTIRKDMLDPSMGVGDSMGQLLVGEVRDAEDALRRLGITFDVGRGMHGADWEWDWSLQGPISVTFKRVARRKPNA